jgi:hypothetical protein
MTDDRDFDVAISFVNQDLGTATAIADGLLDGLRVFLYTKRQEDLAGTDGLESFRAVFRHDARLVVILLRKEWGHTNWTRIESQAITDRFLHEGAEFLFVVMMDDAPPPPWIPDKLIRFSLADFGVQQAVGAIKARALEAGSTLDRPSPAVLAERAQERASFAAGRARLLESHEGAQAAHVEARQLISLIREKINEAIAAAPMLNIDCGFTDDAAGFRVPGVALVCGYRNRVVNMLADAEFVIRELRGATALPGKPGRPWREPIELASVQYVTDLTRDLGWCWRSSRNEYLSSGQLATQVIERFFDLVDRDSAGQLPDLEW